MARPRKPRHCDCPCPRRSFRPESCRRRAEPPLVISPEELTALKLCDFDGLTQSQAGVRMGVSRGSVQRAVKSGRRKLLAAILTGRGFRIGLGEEVGQPTDTNLRSKPSLALIA